jgi:hypothetical protein
MDIYCRTNTATGWAAWTAIANCDTTQAAYWGTDGCTFQCLSTCPAGQEKWTNASGTIYCKPVCTAGYVRDANGVCQQPTCSTGYVWSASSGSCVVDCLAADGNLTKTGVPVSSHYCASNGRRLCSYRSVGFQKTGDYVVPGCSTDPTKQLLFPDCKAALGTATLEPEQVACSGVEYDTTQTPPICVGDCDPLTPEAACPAGQSRIAPGVCGQVDAQGCATVNGHVICGTGDEDHCTVTADGRQICAYGSTGDTGDLDKGDYCVGTTCFTSFAKSNSSSTTSITSNPNGTTTTTTTTRYENPFNGTGTVVTTVVVKDANGNVVSEDTTTVGDGAGDGSGQGDEATYSGDSGLGALQNTEDWTYATIKGRVAAAITPAQSEVATLVSSGISLVRGAFPFSLLSGSLSGFGNPPAVPCFSYTLIGDTEDFCLSAFATLFTYIRAAIALIAVFGFYLLMLRTVREWGTS